MSLTTPPGHEDPLVGLADEAATEAGLTADDAGSETSGAPVAHTRLWRRFARQRGALAGLAFLLMAIVAAVFAPLIAPYPPNALDLLHLNASPSAAHWLGTDDLGRDILSRIIWGARTSLRATFEIVGVAVVFALPIGLVAGYFRGALDSVIMRLMDAMFSFPPLILALTVAALLGASINDTALAIGLVFVPSFVRLIRGQVIAVREENYIESARSVGATSGRLIRRHILPNVASPIIIQVALALGFALLVEAGLAYLGIGEQPPTPSWGGMLQEGFNFIYSAPWALIFPGLAIMLTVLSFNLVADGLRDSLGRERTAPNPRRRARRASAVTGPERSAGGASSASAAPATALAASATPLAGAAAPDPSPPTPAPTAPPPLLEVEHLRIEFLHGDRWSAVVDDVNFDLARGRTLGLVGESGSGKTVSALAVMGLLPAKVSQVHGSVRFAGTVLTTATPAELRRIRGDEISMIFQEPMTSLNPAFTVGNQVSEQVRAHRGVSRAEAWKVAVEMLDRVEIPNAAVRAKDYPHAFSGGMRQRVMIAMALSCSPKLLIADEPTTALDVTTQAQIIELLHTLQREEDMAMIFVTHDLSVIADVADDVVVMYAGQVVEHRAAPALFARPRHPYTDALLESIPQLTPPGERLHAIPGMVPRPDRFPSWCRFEPRCAHATERCRRAPVQLRPASADDGSAGLARCVRQDELVLAGAVLPDAVDRLRPVDGDAPGAAPTTGEAAPLLRLRDVHKRFPVRSGVLRRITGYVDAVAGVDLTVQAGTTVGLVGESGSGKSTLARLVLRLIDDSGGTIELDGADITALHGPALRRTRQAMQMIFQDPYSSLDPKMVVADIVAEPLQIHTPLSAGERRARVTDVLGQVGLPAYLLGRQPHELSGGQRQRVAIARALALEPRLLVCDEPVSALDVSTQSQVINLLADLQDRLGLAYLFVAHDLSVVRHLSDRIAVMYMGTIVEVGTAEEVYRRATHPYTAALLSAIPVLDPAQQHARRRIVLRGEVGEPVRVSGCRFRARCPFAMDICAEVDPGPYTTPSGTVVRCHLHTSGPGLAGAPVGGLAAVPPSASWR